MLYNQAQLFNAQGGGINLYQFSTPSVTLEGNYAALHFETNIVYQGTTPNPGNVFVNLDYQNIIVCNPTNSSARFAVQSKALSSVVTNWGNNATLTFYGDYVFKIESGTSSGLICQIGSGQYNFFASTLPGGGSVYFEQNPMSIVFTNNATDSLLSEQISQNAAMIAQNQTIINQQNQTNQLLEQQQQQDGSDRSDVQDASDSADTNADTAQTQNEATTSNLLNLMGSFIQALQTPATNCQIPADLGNLNLGTIDFCTGKPAEFVPIINTISALVMSFAIYLVARHLVHSFIRITVFAQGGKE